MGNFLRIRCLVPTSVVVEDLNVRLAGKGNEVTVMTSAAEASRDLRRCLDARQVALLRVGPEVWPVAGPVVLPPLPPLPPPPQPVPAPASVPPESSPELLRMLSSIDESLKALLQRPSPPSPEAVAAHMKSLVPAGLPVDEQHPRFIPSTILPSDDGAGSDIKVRTSEGAPVDASVSALKELRKRK